MGRNDTKASRHELRQVAWTVTLWHELTYGHELANAMKNIARGVNKQFLLHEVGIRLPWLAGVSRETLKSGEIASLWVDFGFFQG